MNWDVDLKVLNLPHSLTCHKDEGIVELFEIFRVAWCLDAPLNDGDGAVAIDDEDYSDSLECVPLPSNGSKTKRYGSLKGICIHGSDQISSFSHMLLHLQHPSTFTQ